MGIKKFRPMTPGTRTRSILDNEVLTRKGPEKSLTESMSSSGGRNHHGRITTRRRGGGHKRRYRIIDFKRDKFDSRAEVITVEYDPNRSARIALVHYEDGEKRYIIAPLGLKVGDAIGNGPLAELRPGNALPLKEIPVGTVVHNVELKPGKGGQIARSAGVSAQVLAKEGTYATLRMPSGEMRQVHENCMATLGQVGNTEHGNITLGKAGRRRWLGWRPGVRGTAQDPGSHPHGGGEGRSGIGMAAPKTPWGKPALGVRTRNNKRTDRFIIRRRGKRR